MVFKVRYVALTLVLLLLAACRPPDPTPEPLQPETNEPALEPTRTPRPARPGVTPGPTSISRVTPPSQPITPQANEGYTTPLPLDAPLSTGEPESGVTIGLLSVRRVSVDTTGAQPVAVVEGYLPDGCTAFDHTEQTRTDSTIVLTMHTARPTGAFCTQAIQEFSTTVTLDGDFGAGEYSLIVNDVTTTFTLP